MSYTPLVSILLASYNGEKYINEQISSILKQDYPNIELIVIDDCSTDSTVKIISSIMESDSRVKLYTSTENKGVISTFECGLQYANGEFVAFSDQDDLFFPFKVSAMLRLFEDNPAIDLVISDSVVTDSKLSRIAYSFFNYSKIKPKTGKPFSKLLYSNFVQGSGSMVRRRLIDKAIPFPQNCFMHDWWIGVLAASEKNGGIMLIDKPLQMYRQHGDNLVGAQPNSIMNKLGRKFDSAKKKEFHKIQLQRITGYTNKQELWSDWDMIRLFEAKIMYEGLINNDKLCFYEKMRHFPLRLKFAITKGVGHAIIMIFTSVW